MRDICRPGIDFFARYSVPCYAFPATKIEFCQAGIYARVLGQRLGHCRATRERTGHDARVSRVGQRIHEHGQFLVDQCSADVGRIPQGYIAAAVADAWRRRDGRMANQVEIHPITIK